MCIRVTHYQRDNANVQIRFDSGIHNIVLFCFYIEANNHLASEKFEFVFSQPKTRVTFDTDKNPVFISIEQVTTQTNQRLATPIGFLCDSTNNDESDDHSTSNDNNIISTDIGAKFQKGISMLLTGNRGLGLHANNTVAPVTQALCDTLATPNNKCEIKNENVYAYWTRKSVH